MISVGMKVPKATLMKRLADKTTQKVDLSGKLRGRRVALIGMPGAFTATCSADHLPSLVKAAPELKAKGVDEIIVFCVNDPQVMRAWGEATGATAAGITLLADPQSVFTEALEMRFDNADTGLIGRCIRFSSLVDDGVFEAVMLEEPGVACSLTRGEMLLDVL